MTSSNDVSPRRALIEHLPNGLRRGDTLELVGRSEFTFEGAVIRRIIDVS